MGYPKTTVELFADEEFVAEINIIGTEPVDWIKICDVIISNYSRITYARVFSPRGELLHEIHLGRSNGRR